jgi:hypothetical protein
MEEKNQSAIKLSDDQIVRLYQVVDTHHQIKSAIYMGYNSFNVETDKRSFIFHTNDKTTDYIFNGIKLMRDEQ